MLRWTVRLSILCVVAFLALRGIAKAQSLELDSIFEVDPTLALNGFAIGSAAIVVLFETYRSQP